MKISDLAALSDTVGHNASFAYNAGFIVVKPTQLSRRVYTTIRKLTTKWSAIDDQHALNHAVRQLKKEKSGINATLLDIHQYASGAQYFENMQRLLPTEDDTCSSINKINCSVLVLHNNWIVTKEAKIYRFREHFMWLYDGKDQYYSSQTRKYITYINPKPTSTKLSLADLKRLRERQMSALRTALTVGYLLNRTLILPRFYCGTKALQCPLNSIIHIKTFDAYFSGQYRENSFLQHPQVPDVVKQSLSDQPIVSRTTRSVPTYEVDTIYSKDVIRLFRTSKVKVINVGVLDGIQINFIKHSTDTARNEKEKAAFIIYDYRQLTSGGYLWLKSSPKKRT